MTDYWIKRRAHERRTTSGRSTHVRETWEHRQSGKDNKKHAYRRRCPTCGADIISVRMGNGGWAHFEGAKGLSRIKHPCLHIGDRLSRRRDDKTLDLFLDFLRGDKCLPIST